MTEYALVLYLNIFFINFSPVLKMLHDIYCYQENIDELLLPACLSVTGIFLIIGSSISPYPLLRI